MMCNIRLLKRKYEKNSKFIEACKSGMLEKAKDLLYGPYGRKLDVMEGLWQACLHGHMNIVKWLIFANGVSLRDITLFKMLCYHPNTTANDLQWFYKLGHTRLCVIKESLFTTICEYPLPATHRYEKLYWIAYTSASEGDPLNYDLITWAKENHGINITVV